MFQDSYDLKSFTSYFFNISTDSVEYDFIIKNISRLRFFVRIRSKKTIVMKQILPLHKTCTKDIFKEYTLKTGLNFIERKQLQKYDRMFYHPICICVSFIFYGEIFVFLTSKDKVKCFPFLLRIRLSLFRSVVLGIYFGKCM